MVLSVKSFLVFFPGLFVSASPHLDHEVSPILGPFSAVEALLDKTNSPFFVALKGNQKETKPYVFVCLFVCRFACCCFLGGRWPPKAATQHQPNNSEGYMGVSFLRESP